MGIGPWRSPLTTPGEVGSPEHNSVRSKAGGNIDFWALALPQETRRYVPKLLALADILRHADRYNITLPLLTTQPAMTTVRTFGQIEMQRAAELAGLEPGEVRRLNPAQIRWATAPEGSDSLWLPSAHAARFEQALATITLTDRVMWAHYTIAPGDSLSAIAQRFDSQVAVIRFRECIGEQFNSCW